MFSVNKLTCEFLSLKIQTKLNVLLNWIKDDFITREERFIQAFITRDLPTCGIFSQIDFSEALDFIEAKTNLTKFYPYLLEKNRPLQLVHLEVKS